MSQICLSSWLLLATLGISAGRMLECSGAVSLDIDVSVNVSSPFGPAILSPSRDYFGPNHPGTGGYDGFQGFALQYGSSGTDAWPKFQDQWVLKYYDGVQGPYKVIAVCESGCPASYLHSGQNESVWPKAGIFHAKWRFLVPVVTGDHIAHGTIEGDAFCCKRKPKVCDRLIDKCEKLNVPLVGCNPFSRATFFGCCESFCTWPDCLVPDSCGGDYSSVSFECDHSSAELETAHAMKDAVESVTFV